MSEAPAQPTAPWKFKKGRSGNPAGKPRGLRNRASVLLDNLLDGEAEALVRKTIEMALAGDTVALRLCIERLAPPRKDRPLSVKLPAMNSAGDAVAVTAALVTAVSRGELTPSEGGELSKLVQTFVSAVELQDIEQRLARLEAAGATK